MNIAFMKATDDMLIEKLAGVAKDIWYEYFPSIISVEQIEYMLEKFQSTVAIEKQISTNRYQYYLIFNGREVLGYLGFKEEIKRLFLSKLYLKKEYRGKGYFSEMLSFIEHYAKQKGLKSMYLTVNKHNDHSISVYKKKGFVILEEKVVDIGKGFIMDDYVMEKQLVNKYSYIETEKGVNELILQTQRLILRPWQESDAVALYKYASNPRVGPIAGWPVHTSVENSREIIRNILLAEETYAVVLKGETEPIGSIGLLLGKKSNIDISNNEGEIGYWIGVPYWGQGLIPEAVRELLRHGFENFGLETIWCGYFDGNEKSRRVQEKCGFRFHHTEKDKPWSLMNDIRTEHITCITKDEWQTLNSYTQSE